MTRDCIASYDRMTVDDEFIREADRNIILKYNKMVIKRSKIDVVYSTTKGAEYSVVSFYDEVTFSNIWLQIESSRN
jgi:hypothetical protein